MVELSSSEWKRKGGSAAGQLARTARGGSVKGGESGKRRGARYLLPCLSESKRCRKVENGCRWKTKREKKGKSIGGNKS